MKLCLKNYYVLKLNKVSRYLASLGIPPYYRCVESEKKKK
jgi:hypothetical protein